VYEIHVRDFSEKLCPKEARSKESTEKKRINQNQ